MTRATVVTGTAVLTLALALLGPAATVAAPTDFPILVRALAPAVNGHAADEWVMLQMTAPGQQHVIGETLAFYGSSGAVTGTYAIPSDVVNGQSHRTILLATPGATSATPDFTLDTGNALDPASGALCVTGSYPADCASWGSLPDAARLGLPDPQFGNAEAIVGGALGRRIESGCSTWLGPQDDVNYGQTDFVDGVTSPEASGVEPTPPAPRNNAAAVTETPCLLNTEWNQTPSNPTNDTTPTFAFGEVFPEYGTTFPCRFGAGSSLPGGLAWSACPPTANTYGPLADGTYTFQAYAVGAAGPDPSPLNWTFDVDTVPPQTFIDSVPPEPSNGFSASFGFHSNEPHPKFQCQFESGPIQPCEPGKTIFALSDGPHTFRVWAIDQATNVDPTPAVVTFDVDTTLGDKSAPDTTILSHPSNPASTGKATFTYRSNEPRSTFQCSLDGDPFAACEVAGIAYPRLRNGQHLFKVRATDRAGNLDSIPASFAWSVKAPLPETTITASPPGFQRLRGKAKTRKRKVSFAFKSNEPRSEFRCRLDQAEFKPCRSPKKLRARPGRHRFEVYAIDAVGNVEQTPARRIFRIGSRKDKGFFGAGGGR